MPQPDRKAMLQQIIDHGRQARALAIADRNSKLALLAAMLMDEARKELDDAEAAEIDTPPDGERMH